MAATAEAWSSGSSTTTAFWRRSGRRAVDAGTGARRRRSGVPSKATLSLLASRGVRSGGAAPWGGDALAILSRSWAACRSGPGGQSPPAGYGCQSGLLSGQAKSLVAAQPVETPSEAGAGTGGRGGPFGLPRVDNWRHCGLPRAPNYSNSQFGGCCRRCRLSKSTPGASRRRRRRGDAWGVVLGHFSRRLTSHFRAGYLPTSHDQVANSGFWCTPASSLQPRFTVRISGITETTRGRKRDCNPLTTG